MNNNLLMGDTGLGNITPQNDDLLLNKDWLQTVTDNIIYSCESILTGKQLLQLNDVITEVLSNYEVMVLDPNSERNGDYVSENKDLFDKYVRASLIEGKSQRTLDAYSDSFYKFMEFAQKSVIEVTTDDVRDFLSFKQKIGQVSNATLDNIRRNLSSVFRWLHEEGYILKNPVIKINKIKDKKKVKQPFTPREIELLRREFGRYPKTRARDLAMFELLLSSGIRVGELCGLNRSDVDLQECSMVVLGKGNKQRECYFNIKAQTALELYLETRMDNNPALFVSFKKPYERLGINGVERRIRLAGYNVGVKAHPHKFRRTMATSLLNKGVPIEQVKTLLGHSNLDTTTIYAMVDEEQLNWNHKKLLD